MDKVGGVCLPLARETAHDRAIRLAKELPQAHSMVHFQWRLGTASAEHVERVLQEVVVQTKVVQVVAEGGKEDG
eukprot:scaffold301_cov393-Prasinococcus_capsulatus_cf.AAC.4